MTKRRIAMLVLALTIAVSGCSKKPTDDQPSNPGESTKKDVLIVAQGADPTTLDPQATTDSPAGRVSSQIYQNLVEQDASMNIVPALAESWTIVDGNTYVFNIRQGVKFHNGEELKASDVLYTFKRAAESAHAKSIMATIDASSCRVVSDYVFEMKLSKPFGPILAHLAHNVMSIVNEKAVEEGGERYGQSPVGTGPFKFVKWTVGDSIELERFDDFWGEKPAYKTLRIRSIPETSSRSIEVETGGIDIAIDVLPSDVTRLDAIPEVIVSKTLDFTTNFIGLTCTQGPLKDVRVRQAINYAIDTGSILEAVYQNTGLAGTGPMSPTIWSYTADVKKYDQNIETAKALLAEAGYPDGFEISISTNDQTQRIEITEIVQNQLRAVGIKANVQILEWGTYLEKVYAGTNEMFILGWSASTGDPDYALYSQYYSANKGASGNMTFFSDSEVDRLLDIGRDSTDDAERKAAYEQAQKLIMESAPCVYIQHAEKISAYRSNLVGFNAHPSGTFDFSKISFK